MKKEIFKKAHNLTKELIRKGDSYRATFKLALSFVYSQAKKSANNIEEKLMNKGFKVWENYGCKRIYINNFIELAEKFGIDFKSEKAYSVNPKSFHKIGMYYDLDKSTFYQLRVNEFMNKYVNRVIDAIKNY